MFLHFWSTTCHHGDCSASYEDSKDYNENDDDLEAPPHIEALLQKIVQTENFNAKGLLQAFASIERKKHRLSFRKALKKAKSIGKKMMLARRP